MARSPPGPAAASARWRSSLVTSVNVTVTGTPPQPPPPRYRDPGPGQWHAAGGPNLVQVPSQVTVSDGSTWQPLPVNGQCRACQCHGEPRSASVAAAARPAVTLAPPLPGRTKPERPDAQTPSEAPAPGESRHRVTVPRRAGPGAPARANDGLGGRRRGAAARSHRDSDSTGDSVTA